MSEFSKYILSLFSHFAPWQQVILVLLVGGLLFFGYHFVKNDNFRKTMIHIAIKLFRSLRKDVSLTAHDLFYKQPFFLSHIKNVKFSCDLKTKLFHMLLRIKTRVVIEDSRTWVKNTRFVTMSNEELYLSMFNHLMDLIETYETEIKKEFQNALGEVKGQRAFDLIYLTKDIGFEAIHAENITHITRYIERIAKSEAYTAKQKVFTFLLHLEITLELAIFDCEHSFKLLNGNIEKLNN